MGTLSRSWQPRKIELGCEQLALIKDSRAEVIFNLESAAAEWSKALHCLKRNEWPMCSYADFRIHLVKNASSKLYECSKKSQLL